MGRLNTLQSAVSEAIVEGEEEQSEEEPNCSRRRRLRSRRRRRAGGQARLQHPRPGGGGGRLRCPLRSRRGRNAGPVQDRRRAARGRPRAAEDDHRRDLAGEDHERPRTSPRSGSPRMAASASPSKTTRSTSASQRSRPRRARGRRSASSTKKTQPDPRRPRDGRRVPRAVPGILQPGLRRRTRHRADRLGEEHDPLLGAQGAEPSREKHHHDRGPGRVPARRDQPDQRQPQSGPRLRHRAALDAPRRPRHRDGRRDPRRRDRAGRDRGRAHRPHAAQHPSHQRRPRRDHPADQDGDRGVPDLLGGRLRRRPAPGAQALQPLQETGDGPAAVDGGSRDPGRGRGRGLRAGRLPALQPQRVQRPGRASTR